MTSVPPITTNGATINLFPIFRFCFLSNSSFAVLERTKNIIPISINSGERHNINIRGIESKLIKTFKTL